jgi:hypothetical protein
MSQAIKLIVYFLLILVACLVYAGIFIQNIEYIGSLVSLKEATPPFELAILSIALGGFLLPVSLRHDITPPSHKIGPLLEPDIRITARLSLAAAFSYTSLYALLQLVKHLTGPLNWADWFPVIATDTFLALAPLLFAIAVSCLGYVIIFGVFWKEKTT